MRERKVNPRHRYKRLDSPHGNCSGWLWDALLEDMEGDDSYREVAPVFGREGRYLDRQTGLVWFEQGGRAWAERDVESFRYDLDRLSVRCLSPRERAAIRVLVRLRICPPSLREVLWHNDEAQHLRAIYVSARNWAEEALGDKSRSSRPIDVVLCDAYRAVERAYEVPR